MPNPYHDRRGRFTTRSGGVGNTAYDVAKAALESTGRELIVMDPAEVDDDLVRDMTELLTSMCARLYGKRAASNRAKRAMEASADD